MPSALGKGIDQAISSFNNKTATDTTNTAYWDSFNGLTFHQFWDRVGRPEKAGKQHPIYEYEEWLMETLKTHKYLWVKKATGLGITEFMLRYIAWLCTKDNSYRKAQVCIVTGPRIELAVTLINRIKSYFKDYAFKTKETVVELNGCRIEAYPSHHLDTMRGLPNVKFILLDEGDFFPPGEQQDARDVSERYIAKSDPYIVMVSTPNLPGGLFESIEKEQTCLYKRVFLPYTVGLGTIYTEQDIIAAKQSPSFEREYNLRYGYGIGNIFPYQLVDAITFPYSLRLGNGRKALFVDPAYGNDQDGRGSKFGILGLEQREEGRIYVTLAEQHSRASPSAMHIKLTELAPMYDNRVIVDAHYAGEIRDLQDVGINASGKEFTNETKSQMVIRAAQAVKEARTAIHPSMTDLLYQLKSVRFNEKGHANKKELAFDLGDCFCMGIDYFASNGEIRLIKLEDGIPSSYERQEPTTNPSPEPVWTEEGFKYV